MSNLIEAGTKIGTAQRDHSTTFHETSQRLQLKRAKIRHYAVHTIKNKAHSAQKEGKKKKERKIETTGQKYNGLPYFVG